MTTSPTMRWEPRGGGSPLPPPRTGPTAATPSGSPAPRPPTPTCARPTCGTRQGPPAPRSASNAATAGRSASGGRAAAEPQDRPPPQPRDRAGVPPDRARFRLPGRAAARLRRGRPLRLVLKIFAAVAAGTVVVVVAGPGP